MSTYMCKNKCEDLCSHSISKNNEKLEQNFYGLTDDELKFCKDNKLFCATAYKKSWSAELACKKIYPTSDNKDESDACRHYVWSIFLSQEFGEKTAKIILEAHENNPNQLIDDKEMDTHNNQLGLNDFKDKKLKLKAEDDILNRFKENMKNRKFKILKPFYEKTNGLP